MPKPSNSNPWFLSAPIALLAIALIAAPLDFTPPDWQLSKSAAQAKGDGGGGGKGGGNDNDKGNDKSSAKSGGKDNGKGASAKDDKGGKGNKGGSKAKEETQKRYAKALGLGVDGAGVKPGKSVHTFSAKEVKGLLGNKWKAAKFDDPNFVNHGQRVSTMVKIAKALGYGAWVGAMQANFGTLQELEAAVADAQADLVAALAAGTSEEIAQAQQALAAAEATLADPKPGLGPKGEWATVDLDVNTDGVVDAQDLEAALALP